MNKSKRNLEGSNLNDRWKYLRKQERNMSPFQYGADIDFMPVIFGRGICAYYDLKQPNEGVTPTEKEAYLDLVSKGERVYIIEILNVDLGEQIIYKYPNLEKPIYSCNNWMQFDEWEARLRQFVKDDKEPLQIDHDAVQPNIFDQLGIQNRQSSEYFNHAWNLLKLELLRQGFVSRDNWRKHHMGQAIISEHIYSRFLELLLDTSGLLDYFLTKCPENPKRACLLAMEYLNPTTWERKLRERLAQLEQEIQDINAIRDTQ